MKPTLKGIILEKADEQSLYDLYKFYPSMETYKEFGRRLGTCDYGEYLPVIDFLTDLEDDEFLKFLFHQQEFKSNLDKLIQCLSWKIAAIYNYSNGKVENVFVGIDFKQKYKDSKNKSVISNWLSAKNSKIIYREIISLNSKLKNKIISFQESPDLDSIIRRLILFNKDVFITTCNLIAPPYQSYQSFPNEPSLNEKWQIYPCTLSGKDWSIDLINRTPLQNVKTETFSIKIKKSKNAQKIDDFVKFYKKIKNQKDV